MDLFRCVVIVYLSWVRRRLPIHKDDAQENEGSVSKVALAGLPPLFWKGELPNLHICAMEW